MLGGAGIEGQGSLTHSHTRSHQTLLQHYALVLESAVEVCQFFAKMSTDATALIVWRLFECFAALWQCAYEYVKSSTGNYADCRCLSQVSMCTDGPVTCPRYCVTYAKRVQEEINVSNATLTLLFVSFPCRLIRRNNTARVAAVRCSREAISAWRSVRT